ncbi:FadR family transcriptional regulator [Lampropedia puyangensis]|uniref:FadR family transcriptional regulator n=1 Tax=Lampropedia puyangensis TaxID=1330072 RepID=A0A4S8F269_9BURK|nr:GntR family transcriptional regulator [Lampropedia puyangensis]THU01077.1 FadR family transcriptional regulator [Lampropedia puyangensis]
MELPTGAYGAFRPKQVYEQVADAIRRAIDDGTFSVGSRLPAERELAKRFNVSRPAVREAIGALQNEGLIATRQGSGSYVTAAQLQIAPEDVAHFGQGHADMSPVAILEVRMMIEPAIIKLACRHPGRDMQAERYLEQMAGIRDINDPRQQLLWSDTDRLFHRQLAYMSQDLLVMKMADEIARSMDQPLWKRLRDDGIYEPQRIQLYVAEHTLIYDAVVQGDAEAASFYVRKHLERVRADIAPVD